MGWPLLGWLRGRGGGAARPAGHGAARWQRDGRKVVWRRASAPADVGDVSAPANIDHASAEAAGSALGWLVVRRSPDAARRGKLLSLGAGDTILSRQSARPSAVVHPGRLAFADEFMSGDHALLRRGGQGFEVRERQAGGPPANGLFVNGRRLAGEGAALCDGDVLRLGATELVFKQLHLPAESP